MDKNHQRCPLPMSMMTSRLYELVRTEVEDSVLGFRVQGLIGLVAVLPIPNCFINSSYIQFRP